MAPHIEYRSSPIRHVAEYVCRVCRTRNDDDWRDHCEPCRSWNSIEMDFEEERISAPAGAS